MRAWRCRGLLLVLLIALTPAATATAATSGDPDEPYDAGWTLFLDNDLLALLSRDQQYTGGASLELAGRRAVEFPWSLDPVVGLADRISGFGRLSTGIEHTRRHSFTLGISAFTPEDIRDAGPIFDDHPYGSLITIGNSRQTIRRDADVRYQSSVLLGLLGTNAAQQLQNAFHDLSGSDRAQGWDNQISAGGELTFRYMVSRQQILAAGPTSASRGYDWRYDLGGSVGYVTEATVGTSVRWGRLGTQWWTFDPAYGDYIHLGAPRLRSAHLRPREWFFWVGVKGRARLYNALLEGQFRDSTVTFSRSDLRILTAETAAGFTADIPDTNLRATFELRYRTREIPDADGELPVWGRISLSRSF